MNHVIEDIQHKYTLLNTAHRTKRALLNAVGVISKTLFGTLNEDDAEYYDSQIKTLESNENHLMNLIRNQTIILETTANIFNKSQHVVEKQMNALDAKISRLNSMFLNMSEQTFIQKILSEMESLTSLTTLIIVRYQNVLNSIIDLLSNIHHGKPHPSIVTPEQLKTMLTLIRKEIPDDIRLPSSVRDDKILPLYQVSTVAASLRNNKIIYELKLPLPHKENFQLYKITPLPTRFNGRFVFIQPTMKYLVIDYDREHFYDLTPEEMSHCVSTENSHYLCRIMHPLYNSNSRDHQCEIKLIRRDMMILPPSCKISETNLTTVWVQLSEPNRWLYSTLDDYSVDSICKDHITPHTLRDAGLVEIPPNCYLRSKELTIRGYSSKSSSLKNSFVPPINISAFLSNATLRSNLTFVPKLGLIKFSESDDFNKLSSDITFMKEQETKDLKKIDFHNVHHYTITYILSSVLVIYSFYRCYQRCCCCLSTNIVCCKKSKRSAKRKSVNQKAPRKDLENQSSEESEKDEVIEKENPMYTFKLETVNEDKK